MKALKIIGYIVLGLLGVYVVAAAIAPSSLKVEKSITINTTPATVFAQVSCFDQWPSWSPWAAMDPNMTNVYSENPCGLGAWNSWTGEQTGEGKQEIVELIEKEYLKTTLVFGGEPEPQISEWFFVEEAGATKVTWNFIGSETSFLKRPMNLMGEYFVSKAYVSGLEALKKVAEAAPVVKEYVYDIQTIDNPETKYLLISGDVKPADIGQFYTDNYAKIMVYMTKKGVAMAGHPSGFFYNWTDTLAKMAAAVPLDKEVVGLKEIEYHVVPGGKALLIDYYGAYEKTEAAHYEMDDYMDENNLELNGAVVEVYVTDPTTEPDTSKWLTKIIYPVGPAK